MVLVLGLVAVSQVSAQLISGNLVGTVLDKTGAVVPHAAVEAANTPTGARDSTTANDAGEYRFNNMAAGPYNNSAAAPKLATTTDHGHALQPNHAQAPP